MPNNANKRHLRRREQCSLSVNYSFDLTKELIFLWNLERFFAKSGTLRVFLQNEHVKRNQQKKFGQSVGISGHVLSNTLFRSKYIKNTVFFQFPQAPLLILIPTSKWWVLDIFSCFCGAPLLYQMVRSWILKKYGAKAAFNIVVIGSLVH